MALFEGLRTLARFGRRDARSYRNVSARESGGVEGLTMNRPFKVSRRCLSTALCVARRSAVLALLEGLRFSGPFEAFPFACGAGIEPDVMPGVGVVCWDCRPFA
jgi:hypothetical protein